MVHYLDRIVGGNGKKKDLDILFDLCSKMHGLTLCPGGDASSMPMEAMLRKFKEEFEALVQ